MRCTQTAEAGAYVLGALSPAERSAYERHIAACVTCRNEVAELAGLPGLLGRLDADTAASIGQPEGAPEKLLHTVLASARTERVRLRRRHMRERGFIMLAAACLAVVVGAGVSTMSIPAAPPPVLGAMTPTDQGEPVNALLGYWADTKGGTEIKMTCSYASGSITVPYTLATAQYPEDDRCDVLAGCGGPHTTVDDIGVRITYTHQWVTRFGQTIAPSITFQRSTAVRMEPTL